ncbi:DUF2236 domain-containing protein [Yimella sp. cx-573]|nr:DUF2236 domain-containing protein [Yimella sp. cx-573]
MAAQTAASQTSAVTAGYRDLVQTVMAAESFAAFQLAFLRPFAVPHMADRLVQAGFVTSEPELRAYRTGLQMYEVIEGGFTSPRARRVLAHINRAHRGRSIPPSDFGYVLNSFIVVPIRHIETFGWRRATEGERQLCVDFYRLLGARMAITELPSSYSEAADRFDAYESRHVRPSNSTRELGRLTLGVLQGRLPRQMQHLAPRLFATQLNDDRVAEALGMPPSSVVARTLLRPALKLHGAQTAVRHRRRPFFTPGQPARLFPQGYSLDEIL